MMCRGVAQTLTWELKMKGENTHSTDAQNREDTDLFRFLKLQHLGCALNFLGDPAQIYIFIFSTDIIAPVIHMSV